MVIGVPKEIKTLEHRVGLVPSSVRELVKHGHTVWIEQAAGEGIDFDDADYLQAGARIARDAAEVFGQAQLIIKVKEPQPDECTRLTRDHVLFAYLHLAADKAQAEALLQSGCIAIAYETVVGRDGRSLPLLQPMSEVAGRLSTQVGAHYLLKHNGGRGRLIGGIPGVKPAEVVLLGGGTSGFHAAQMAVGLGANITIFERSNERMRFLDEYFLGRANIVYSNLANVEEAVTQADLVIGAVLIPGAAAPRLVSRALLKRMKRGAVLVDIAIDQGGCFESSRPTTHADPVFVEEGVVHYCVSNMPGAVPLTSALGLNHSILPYALALADRGWQQALEADPGFAQGLNVCKGHITHAGVATSLGLPYRPYAPGGA